LVRAEYGYPKDLQIPIVTEEIRRYSSQYSARLNAHPNDLIVQNLLNVLVQIANKNGIKKKFVMPALATSELCIPLAI
jgi:hypothetical protein